MKQTFFLITLFFGFNLFSSQETFNCEKEYKLAKLKYEELFSDVKNVNYETLPETIINNIDLKKINGKSLVLYYSNIFEFCPSGVPNELLNCKSFYPEIPYFNEETLWTKKNILFLQSKIKKDIVPKTSFGFLGNKNDFLKQFKTEKYREGMMTRIKELYYPNSDKKFLYFPFNSKKLIIAKSNDYLDVYKDTATLKTIVNNISSKQVKIEYIFENDHQLNYIQIFNFVDNSWKLSETK